MVQIFISGWTLGLATGTTCLSTCVPIYLPYLLSEKRTNKQSFLIVLKITVGRFFSYVAFGAAFGFVGSKIPIGSRLIFTSIAYILLSIYLITMSFRVRSHNKNCTNIKWMKFTKNPFLLGVLTGISFCPAFLIAISSAIDISGVSGGIILFIAFFFGTSMFIFPITFLGVLSKIKNLRKIAIIASVIIAFFFIYKGISGIIHYSYDYTEKHDSLADSLYIAKPFFDPKEEIYIVDLSNNEKWNILIDILNIDSIKTSLITSRENIDKIPQRSAIISNSTQTELDLSKEEKAFKIINVNISNFDSREDFEKIVGFLNKVYFRYNPAEGYQFPINHPPSGNY